MIDSNSPYQHTQLGFVIIGALAIGMLIMALGYRSMANTAPPGPIRTGVLSFVAVIAIGVAIVGFLFSSLSIEIRDGELRWHFTTGVIHGSVPLRDVAEVKQVRHPAAYGWGYRITGNGILYRVSGLDAVRIRMRDGRVFNLGSDEPARLARAIEQAILVR